MILKKYFEKIICIGAMIILLSFLFCGCGNSTIPGQGEIIIAGGEEITDDSTPILTILFSGADYMSFSGDGEEWTEWMPYVTSYEGFNIASGEFGTSTGEGLKFVYGCFKDLDENILSGDELVYDTIIYTPPPSPTKGSIVIAGGNEVTDYSTPTLIIFSEGADYMSFSGDGQNWTEWVPYSESYEDFDIANGEYGTEFSQGEKYVYVRFKNENGDLSPQDDLAGDDISFILTNLDLKYIRVEPTKITMKVNTSQVFIVKGINRNLNEVPLDGSKVSWSYCCHASTTPLSGSVKTTYTAPSGTGVNKYLRATYDEKYQKSAWITVVE
jgi:predicted small secreted protein